MFISNSNRGYTRSGEQRASGRFLILFSHNGHKWEEQNNTPHTELTGQTFDIVNGDGFVIQAKCQCGGTGPCAYGAEHGPSGNAPSYYLKYCPVHKGEYRTWQGNNRELYAHVCHVAMKQLGQFMMGESRTLQVAKSYGNRPAPNNLILSGTYGGDGLPCDYEDLTEKSRAKLVRVPDELAEKFWVGGGWNSAGSEAQSMHDWAIATFVRKGKGI